MTGRSVPPAHTGLIWDRTTGSWRPPQRDGLTGIHREDRRRKVLRETARKEREQTT